MHRLPPLNALRAFEVAARTGSFAQAGAELGVTAAAVSQQVKHLEGWLGKTLFLRSGNRIILSDAGRAAYPGIEQAFSDLAGLTAALSESRPKARLVVSVLPVLSERWLIGALAGWKAGPGADTVLDLRVELDPVAFAKDRIDLRLTYGAVPYPDYLVQPLWRDRTIAVATAGFVARWLPHPLAISDLPEAGFIHTHWGTDSATEPTWANFLAAARIARLPDPTRGLHMELTSLAIAAAEAGLGMALAPEGLVGDALAAGRLVRALPQALALAHPYTMVLPHAHARRPSLRGLMDHLAQAAPTAGAPPV